MAVREKVIQSMVQITLLYKNYSWKVTLNKKAPRKENYKCTNNICGINYFLYLHFLATSSKNLLHWPECTWSKFHPLALSTSPSSIPLSHNKDPSRIWVLQLAHSLPLLESKAATKNDKICHKVKLHHLATSSRIDHQIIASLKSLIWHTIVTNSPSKRTLHPH